jgi:hypothetical protein
MVKAEVCKILSGEHDIARTKSLFASFATYSFEIYGNLLPNM